MRQFAVCHEPVFDADPEPGHPPLPQPTPPPVLVSQGGPPDAESLSDRAGDREQPADRLPRG